MINKNCGAFITTDSPIWQENKHEERKFLSMRAGVWEDTGIKQCFGTFVSNFYLTLLESVLNDSLDTCPLTETPRSLFVTLTEEKSNKSECSNQSIYYRVHSH